MKKRIVFILFAIATSHISLAQTLTPIVIPSGQQLYFSLSSSGVATIYAPNNNGSSRSWNGYPKPGGNVVIPDTVVYNGLNYVVTTIEERAFVSCDAITSIVIPNTVNRISTGAFYFCTSLRTLTIGSGLRRIATPEAGGTSTNMILNCPNLDTIYYNADSCTLGQLFGDGSIGQHTAVIIGENVRYIGNNMFSKGGNYMTNSIESAVVGSSVISIGDLAFANCTSMTSITFRSQTPPFLGVGVFNNVNTGNVQCNIPCGSTSYYFNQWSTLFNYTEASSGYSLQVSSNYDLWGTAEIIQQPSCTGDAVIGATASCGYYFVRWSDGNTNNPRTLTLQNNTYLTAIFASSYNVPDTLYVHDTTTINNYIHDTTYLPIYLHDTVPMVEYLHDTIYLPQYIHDTTIINNHFRDTIYLPQYFHDTTYVTLTDTLTITQFDTITNTIFDTVDNYIYDTVTVIDTLWMTQLDTIWLHDTVYIHDTIYITQEGINGAESLNTKVYSSNRRIVVEGADGNQVTLYDVTGRVLATKQDHYAPLRFDAPVSGTYLLKIGNYPARRVVVIR